MAKATTALDTHVENWQESMADGMEAGAGQHTTQGSVRERLKRAGERDVTYISDAQKKAWGIQDTEHCAWIRDPSKWQQYEKSDRAEEICSPIEEGGKDARVVYKNAEYDKITRGDLMLVAIRDDIYQGFQGIIDDSSREFEQGISEDPTEEYGNHSASSYQHIHAQTGEEYDPGDVKFISNMVRAEHDYNVRTGLVGGNSPTAGMSYLEAKNFVENNPKRKAELERKQEMLRMGGGHSSLDKFSFTELMLGGEANMKKTYGFGETGIGKTTQQKLAARGKGA